PASGSITRCGRLSYLPQESPLDSETTIDRALRVDGYLAAFGRVAQGEAVPGDFDLLADRWDLQERIEMVFAKLGLGRIALSRRMGSLSGGEAMRVRIAGLLLEEPDFLLLDEPTNNLDLTARDFIYQLVSEWKRGLIVVSHDRKLISLVDQIAELSASGLRFYGGNFDFYREQRRNEREAAEAALASAEQRLKEARLLAARARERQQHRQAAGRKSAFKAKVPPIVAGNRQSAAENTAGRIKGRHEVKIDNAQSEVSAARLNVPLERQITIDLAGAKAHQNKRMIELIDINYRYPDAQRQLWQEPLSLVVYGAERVWLKGPNGSGKSTLIDLICGRKQPVTGVVRLGTERLSLLDQGAGVLDASLSVLENIKHYAPVRPEHELRILLGRFLFVQDDALKPVSVLSGGEKMRAALACLLGSDRSPELLIADEPTNNLDLPSIDELVSVIGSYRGTLIVVSHDITFIEEIGIEREVELTV
ncbi:MAG: ABC-F family ATP-binding cassette domain-containing protein, partial [Blastocatellia bacterium]|nr:ABC-F family ATP-binding cassette domain-containing protein [Blastocatellia bacterium]